MRFNKNKEAIFVFSKKLYLFININCVRMKVVFIRYNPR